MSENDAVIVGPDGSIATIPQVSLTESEARLLRAYRRFLDHHHLREALYCNNCWEGNLQDGCGAAVTDFEILIKCRCKMRVYIGSTY